MIVENKILKQLFSFLAQKKIRYALMGDVEHYNEPSSGDIDLFVPAEDIKTLKNLVIDFVQLHNYKIVAITNYQVNGYAYTISQCHFDKTQVVSLDFSSCYSKRGKTFITEQEFVNSINYDSEKKYNRINAFTAFSYYSTKKIYKGSISLQQFDYLLRLFDHVNEHCPEQLTSNAFLKFLSKVLQERNHLKFQTELPFLRQKMLKVFPVNAENLLKDTCRLFNKIIKPEGRVIAQENHLAIYGSDIETVIENLSGIFKGEKIYTQKKKINSSVGFFSFLFDIYPRLIRGELVFILGSINYSICRLLGHYCFQSEKPFDGKELTDSFVSAMHEEIISKRN